MGSHLLHTFSETLSRSISATTRTPRPDERDGVDYHFLDEAEFKKRIENEAFFEWAEVHGNLYGTLKETVSQAISSGRDLLLDIDLQGIRSFKASYPRHTVVSFIVPPTAAVLRERLRSRSIVSEDELTRRLQTAAREYAELRELADVGLIEYFVVNDDREHCRKLVTAIYEAERLRVQRIDRSELNSICAVDSPESI